MKYTRLLILGLFLFFTSFCSLTQAEPVPATVKTVNGITIRVTYLSADIIHVMKYPSTEALPQKQSYSVILPEKEQLKTHVTFNLDPRDGCITFMDPGGYFLLRETGTPTLEKRGSGADPEKLRIAQTWQLDAEEDIYGLGQLRDTCLSWRGRDVELWNHNTYIAIPYITSSRGYGLYWDNAGKSRFKDSEKGMQFSSEVGECIDYYFIYRDGTQDGVMAGVRALSGQATLFPLWTLGHWQCRERYKTSDELADVLDKYRELQIPLDGIVQDWQYWGCDSNWNAMKFQNPYYINKVGDAAWEKYLPDDLKPLAAEYKAQGRQPRLKSPEEMVNYVHQNHAHLMISIWASFGSWTEPYQELQKIGGLLPFDTWPRNKGVLPYDPFNPQARDIYWKYLNHLYQMGFDAWWTDSTEPDHFEESAETDAYQTHDGSWLSVKNAFPLLTNRGIYEHQRAAKGNKKRSVQMTRSGAFGLQHYGAFSWSGDIQASWQEMKNQIPSGLNYTLCGIPFWNTDLGGFFYWDYEQSAKNPAIQELQTRWMQWGTFMPLMRNHCSSPMISEIYEFGQPGDWAYDAMVDAVKLRYKLLPYIYSLAGEVTHHSGMMMRPLLMDFTSDVKARRLNDEYMFGRAFLVKPVTDALYTWKDDHKHGHEKFADIRKESLPVSVYLPAGTLWYDFFTGTKHEGGQTLQRPTPISDMPVYVRAGSIVPFGPEVQYSTEKKWDAMEIHIYPGADGRFTLYEDEGDNYNYEQGLFSEIDFVWNDASQTLRLATRKGQYPGMLLTRSFTLVLPDGMRKTIQYDGRAQEISFKL